MRLCRPVYGRSEKYVTLESIQLDKVESFRYLGDKICPGGVVTQSKLLELEQHGESFVNCFLFLHPPQSLAGRGNLYDSYVRGALLHTSECWPLQREEVQRLLRNQQAMSSWMLKIKTAENVNLSKMYG